MCRKNTGRFTLLLILIFGGTACKNSDSWLGRQWNNTNAHYNKFFNAEQKWLETEEALRESHADDYRKFIDIYNYGAAEQLKNNQGAMDEVIKKASTMIDRHPKSRWVDNAYLLMGKAYFLKGDFFAATDIFEFVNSSFKDPVIVYQSRLWVFKSLMFQDKLPEAESFIVTLSNDKKFPKKLLPELNKALGAVYLKNDKPGQAIKHLEYALKYARGKMNRYRLHFALGQALQKTEKYTEAEKHFAKVVRMNPPYEMAFNARINQVELLSAHQKDYEKANSILRSMLRDDKNLEYFGQIYYRLGTNELRAARDKQGIAFLNQSLQNSQNDKIQSTSSYLALGDYYFARRNFEKAGLYYDSANAFLDEKHPDYAGIAKKGKQLGDLLLHLNAIRTQDSLLRLARDPVLREKTIDYLIEEEKRVAANPKPGNPKSDPNINNNPINNGSLTPGGSTSFPFYNTNSRNKGVQDFQALWGKRENTDYWRIKAKKVNDDRDPDDPDPDDKDTSDPIPSDIADERKKYYKDIPMTREEQKLAEGKIEDAYFGAAQVYQNTLEEPASAIFYYKELLRRFPATKYEAQTLYELAKLYRKAGNTVEYTAHRNMLEKKYPESSYIKLLDDPNAEVPSSDRNSIERKEIQDLYILTYNTYKAGDYQKAMELKLEADKKFMGNALQPKFDYIYALCLIKTGNLEKGISLLEQVAADYPGSEVANQAEQTVAAYKRMLSPESKDSTDKVSASWTVWDGSEELYYLLSFPRGSNTNLLRASIADFNKTNFIFETLDVSQPRIFGETVYLSVGGFKEAKTAKEYFKYMQDKGDFFASKGLFEYEQAWITKTNYALLLQNNRVSNYLEYFKTIE